jgi:hypothetical protein
VAKYKAGGKSFASIEAAKVYAEAVFAKSGVVIGIEKAAKKLSKKAVAAKIQNAIYGFQIPMMSIPKLYKYLEELVAADVSEDGLKLAVASFLKPKESM